MTVSKLKIIEEQSKEDFIQKVSEFITTFGYKTVKFQRNLYYGVSGSTTDEDFKKELKETYVAFIIYELNVRAPEWETTR